jgi:acetyltransferase EpsM
MEKIIIIGDKSSAILASDYIYDAITRFGSKYEILGFASDSLELNVQLNEFPIISDIIDVHKNFEKYSDVKYIYQMYDIKNMKEAIEKKDKLNIPLDKYLTFIHPSCMVAKSSQVGVGTLLYANCVVNSNAKIGMFNSIMSGVTIGHDAKMGNYNLIATQAIVANIIMGDRNFIGINTTTNNKISIGDDCMIGMASNVVKDVPSGVKCFGNPVKIVDTPKRLR